MCCGKIGDPLRRLVRDATTRHASFLSDDDATLGNSIGVAPSENFAKTRIVTSSITATGSTTDLNVRDKDEERTADRFLEERAREREDEEDECSRIH